MTIYVSIKLIMKTNKMCDLLFDDVFLKYNLSKNIISNREFLFINNFWLILCFYAKIKRKFNIVFYLQTNEQTKKQNQIFEHYLKCFCNHKQNNWIFLLFMTTFVYNCVKHAFIDLIFFEILFEYIFDFNFKFDIAQFDISTIKKKFKFCETKKRNFKKFLNATTKHKRNESTRKF